MNINEKIYEKDYASRIEYEAMLEEMQMYCLTNGYSLDGGEDENGFYYIITENPAPELDDVKAEKIAELKFARDVAEQVPVTTDKGTFDVDDKSITRISNAITVLQLSGGSIAWTLADNTVADVTAADLQTVIVVLAKQSNEVHEKYRGLKEKVNACTDVDSVKAIVW